MKMRLFYYPSLYLHFKGKYYYTLGVSKPISLKEWDMLVDMAIKEAEYPDYIRDIQLVECQLTEEDEIKQFIKINDFDFYHLESEYNEEYAIYMGISNINDKPYARPLSMFLSKVDKKKYPDSHFTFRFSSCSSITKSYKKGENINEK